MIWRLNQDDEEVCLLGSWPQSVRVFPKSLFATVTHDGDSETSNFYLSSVRRENVQKVVNPIFP
jgi:hypothetical protein